VFDPCDPEEVPHRLWDIIRLRVMMFAAGYKDGIDTVNLQHDPSFKLALERGPVAEPVLCS